MSMEGILLKWTNYLSGWQPRWFVLDNGVLSYYKSQEEVNSGCKGSIKMSVCDISVHSTDRCRLDLIIPGEQHFYIRASSPQDRQQWLVALGTAKASLTNGRPTEQTGEISPDIVRSKKSELRLYCDLLMQQVHSVKTAVQEKTPPDIQKLDEATVLLGATCDTFIQTLEDCMKIANASIAYESPHQQINDSPFPTVALKTPNKKGLRRQPKSPSLSNTVHSLPDKLSSARRRTASENSFSNSDLESDQSGSPLDKSNRSRSLSQSHTSTSNQSQSIVQNLNLVNEHPVVNVNDGKIDQNGSNSVNFNENSKVSPSVQTEEDLDVFKDAVDDRIPTFFSEMRPSFMDLPLHKDGGIPVESFLGSCKSLVPIFDKFNATAFAPVKMDFQGNIRKLQQKYQTNPTTLTTLQKIVLSEMNSKQHLVSSSATIALLWMKRSLEFIKECLNELYQGQPDLSTAVSNAYGKSLKPYHGWVVRGVFAVAVKALPYRDVFIAMLNVQGDQSESFDFNQCLMTDMESYITALEVVIKILNDFYRSHSINSDDQV